MGKKNTGKLSRSSFQSEIRPGDIWRDSYGKKVTVRSVIPMRIYYDREGYDHICFTSRFKFIEEFTPENSVKGAIYTVSLNPLKILEGIRVEIRRMKGEAK